MERHSDKTSRQSLIHPVLDRTNASPDTDPAVAVDRPVQQYLDTVMFPSPPAGLSSKAIYALTAAISHFDWEILTRKVGDQTKSIVLFGEQHGSNDPVSVERAKAVLEHFSMRATEGICVTNYPLSALYRETIFDHTRAGYKYGGAIDETDEALVTQSEHIASILAGLQSRLEAHLEELNQNPETPRALVLSASDFSAPDHIFNEVITALGARVQNTPPDAALEEHGIENTSEPVSDPGIVARFRLEHDHRPGIFGKLHAINEAVGLAARKFLGNEGVINSLLAGGLVVFPVSVVAHITTHSTLATVAYYGSLPVAATLGSLVCLAQTRKHLPFLKTIDNAVMRVNEFLGQKDLAERDQTMSAETCRIMEENSEIKSLLVQVGKAHIPGIKTQLEKAGWRSEASAKNKLPD